MYVFDKPEPIMLGFTHYSLPKIYTHYSYCSQANITYYTYIIF